MRIELVNNDFLDQNTYLLIDKDKALIIDPGFDFVKIDDKIKAAKIKQIAIYLTHGHYDHIISVTKLVAKYQASVFAHEKELTLLNDSSLNLSNRFEQEITLSNVSGVSNELCVFDFVLPVYLVPGHTSGHSMLEVKELKSLITGDFIFKEEIGRCDLPTGSIKDMYQSLTVLKKFSSQYRIYPGHGETSTLQHELKYNKYLIKALKNENK